MKKNEDSQADPSVPPITFWERYAGVLVLALGLMMTAFAVVIVVVTEDKFAEKDFLARSDQIRQVIADRIDDHARILLAGAALFNAADTVTRESWRVFNQQQMIEKRLPGIQGIGFSLLIPREGLSRHIEDIRAEGFPEYMVRPQGDRDVYSSIVYLEPFNERNRRAFGYDMYSEPLRRKAMEQARDTGSAALSGKVVLVQETDQAVQAGTLMYVPVYRRGMPADTLEQRRAAIMGWVYSPYRMADLIRGILGRGLLNDQLHLQVFDGAQVSTQALLFDDRSMAEGARPRERFTRQSEIEVNGQRWTLRFIRIGLRGEAAVGLMGWIVLCGGVVITGLLVGLTRSLQSTGRQARQMAQALALDLKKVSDRLHLATTTGGVGVWDYDIVNNRLIWDEQMYRLYGITAEKFSGAYAAWRSGLHPQDVQRGDNEMQMALRGEKEFNTEFRVLHPDGAVHYIRAMAVVLRDDAGKPLRMVGTNWDISELKRVERVLVASEGKFHLLLDSTFEAIFGIDLDGACTFCNPACVSLLKYEHEVDLIGRNIHAKIHARFADGTPLPVEECRISRVNKGGASEHVQDEVFWCADGTAIPVEYRASPQYHEGVMVGAVVTFQDISERLRVAKELHSLKLQIVQNEKLASLGEMAAGMAHEINQPLGAIALVTAYFRKLIVKKVMTEERLESGIKDIESSVWRMSTTIKHVRAYSRQDTQEMERVDLAGTIDSALMLMGEQLRLHGIEVVKSFDPQAPQVIGAAHQLEQVWINFISNARDSMDEKKHQIAAGELILPDYRAQLVIALSHHKPTNALEVRFTDNGMGMSEVVIGKAFEPFFTTKEVGRGTGLGLSISTGIIQSHQGTVEIESPPGEGVTLKVCLPAAAGASAGPAVTRGKG